MTVEMLSKQQDFGGMVERRELKRGDRSSYGDNNGMPGIYR